MSFINNIAFDERLAVLEIEGTLTVGGDILLQGEFPKIDQKLATLNSSIALKANQSDMDEMEVTLNTKANQEDIDACLSLKANQSDIDLALGLTEGQIATVNILLGNKADQVDMENNATLISVLDNDLTDKVVCIGVLETDLESNASRISILDTVLTDDVVRIGVLESELENNASCIQGLYDADYAPKTWVEDKNYETETETDVANSFISADAISTLISGATQGLSTTTQLNTVNQSVSD